MEELEREGGFKRFKRERKSLWRLGLRWWENFPEKGKREKEKKGKEKIKNNNNILILLYWLNIRPAPNGAQKLQKLENIILRCKMKTVSRNSIRFAN